MAQLVSDRRDIDFVLYEQLEIEDLVKTKKYNDLNRKIFDMVISEARNLGIKEILPTYTEGDREGVQFENGRVTVPQCFHRPYQLFVEGEWIAMAEDTEVGGQGFPWIIRQAAFEYIIGANFAIAGFGNLGHGAAKMIELFGTPQQKDKAPNSLWIIVYAQTPGISFSSPVIQYRHAQEPWTGRWWGMGALMRT